MERGWVDTNLLCDKYLKILDQLYEDGHCEKGRGFFSEDKPCGDYCCRVDIFCVRAVFLPVLEKELSALVEAKRLERKCKSTKNPNALQGVNRKFEIYYGAESAALMLPTETLKQIGDAGIAACPDAKIAPYIVDPLSLDRSLQDRRAAYVESKKPATLREEYLAYREATIALANEIDTDDSDDEVDTDDPGDSDGGGA